MVSIIVPVYNAESFLSRCLDSIKNQTYKNIDVILINDGSTDNSGHICELYCKEDERFRVIHKKNGGVSSARNLALEYVKGDYLCFVDPDDWIELDMIETLYKSLTDNDAQISACGYYKEENGRLVNTLEETKLTIYSKDEAMNTILDEDKFKGYLWNKLFSVSLLNSVPKIRFNQDVHFCEDLLFTCECILKSNKIVYYSKPYYHYIIHDNNTSKAQYSEKKLTSLIALEKIIDIINDEKNININRYKNLYINMNLSLLMNYIKENNSDKIIYKKLKENLYKYKIKELTSNRVKISCLLARINVKLFYFIWIVMN